MQNMYSTLRHRDLFRSYKITESWSSGVDSSCVTSLQLAWRQGGRALAPFKRRSVSAGSSAQMGAMKLVMEKQISLEWLDSARPKVQVEKPSKVFVWLRGGRFIFFNWLPVAAERQVRSDVIF